MEAQTNSGHVPTSPPEWARALLVRPDQARVEGGVIRFPVSSGDENINYYRAIGGAHFHERSNVSYAMSSLDTPIYRSILERVSISPGDIVLDVGGGDGRNVTPWIEAGARVIVVDVVADALARLRERLAQRTDGALERVLLVEADARALPLKDGCANVVTAIEALCYLNEDYERGFSECARVLATPGIMVVSERDSEGALLTQALYQDLATVLRSYREHSMWDGLGESLTRTKCLSEDELAQMFERHGLHVRDRLGTPLLSLLLGWLRGQSRLPADAESMLPEVRTLLADLSQGGRIRRCNTIIATR